MLDRTLREKLRDAWACGVVVAEKLKLHAAKAGGISACSGAGR